MQACGKLTIGQIAHQNDVKAELRHQPEPERTVESRRCGAPWYYGIVSLGAWMIMTRRLRAALITWFMRGVIVATRCADMLMLRSDMAEERPEARSMIDEYVAHLKSIVPQVEHGALDSRVKELKTDPSASEEDVISIVREEFDPEDQP